MTDNNGNLKAQDVYVPNNDGSTNATLRQFHSTYSNRLTQVNEYTGNGSLEQQKYVIDRYGNCTIDYNGTSATCHVRSSM